MENFPAGKNDNVRSVLVKIVRWSLKVHKCFCHSV